MILYFNLHFKSIRDFQPRGPRGPRKWTGSWVFSSWYNVQSVSWIDLFCFWWNWFATEVVASFCQKNGHALASKQAIMHFVKVLIVLLLRSHMVLSFKPIIMNIIFCQWTSKQPLAVLVESVSRIVRQQHGNMHRVSLWFHMMPRYIQKLYTLELVFSWWISTGCAPFFATYPGYPFPSRTFKSINVLFPKVGYGLLVPWRVEENLILDSYHFTKNDVYCCPIWFAKEYGGSSSISCPWWWWEGLGCATGICLCADSVVRSLPHELSFCVSYKDQNAFMVHPDGCFRNWLEKKSGCRLPIVAFRIFSNCRYVPGTYLRKKTYSGWMNEDERVVAKLS